MQNDLHRFSPNASQKYKCESVGKRISISFRIKSTTAKCQFSFSRFARFLKQIMSLYLPWVDRIAAANGFVSQKTKLKSICSLCMCVCAY